MKNKEQKKSKTGIIIAAIGVVVILAACVVGYVAAQNSKAKKTEAKKTAEENEPDDGKEDTIVYNGQKYKYNYDLKNILFLGVDKSGTTAEVKGYPGYNGQSDTIVVFVMNTKDKTTTMLEISRDSMVDVKIYDISGKYVTTEHAQITLQYAFGDGGKKSCQLTKDAVSKLLYNVPIRSYMALTMEGISKITDFIGGVKLTIPEDYTYIDPSYTAGAEVTLNGEQAERYVRYRDTNVTGSNNQRMERQTQFMLAMASQLKGAAKINATLYNSLIGGAQDYIITDMSADEMQTLSEYEMSDEVLKAPGETVAGTEHDEFVINNDELYQMLLKVFYKPVN